MPEIPTHELVCVIKKCRVDKYLKNCTCIKNIVHNLVVTCDEILNASEIASINSINKNVTCKIDFCILSTVLLLIMCLLLLIVIAIDCYYYIKQRTKTKCLISY